MDSASFAHEDSSREPLEDQNSGYHTSLESETPTFGDPATVPRAPMFLPHNTSSLYAYGAPTSPTQGSVASEYGQSYAPTLSEASTSWTSVPETVPGGLALGNHGLYLPCDFVGWGACNETFDVDDFHGWVGHVEQDHLGHNFPRKVMCWFCSETFKVGKSASQDEYRTNFWNRMQHIQNHIRGDRKDEHDIRVDFHYAEHLHSAKLISDDIYRRARRAKDVIPYPDGSHRHVPLARDIYPASFVPPEMRLQKERETQIPVDTRREEKDRRRPHRKR
ncbi:hypothetical protein DL768_004316 [Monosporascus sp. mg162]|nr:hypothetical protein DL768_004316 [Monosporascus sp. mg162]